MHRVSILNGGLCHDVHKWNERKNEKEEEDLYENASICMFYNFSSAPLGAFIFLHILYRYNDINYPALAILCEAHCIPKPFRIDHLNWALFTPLEIGCPKLCRHIRFLCNVCKHLPQQLAKTFDVIRRKKKRHDAEKFHFRYGAIDWYCAVRIISHQRFRSICDNTPDQKWFTFILICFEIENIYTNAQFHCYHRRGFQ